MRQLLLGLLLISAAVRGEELFRSDAPTTDYFTELEKLFASGKATAPSKEELTRWISGRCYYHNAHKKAVASVFVGFERAVGGDHGSLFPGKKQFKYFLLVNKSEEANYFEEITQKTKGIIQSYVTDYHSTVTPAVLQDGAIVVDYSASSSPRVRYATKGIEIEGKKYYISIGTLLEDWKELVEGDTHSACYYSETVKVSTKPEPPQPVEEEGKKPGGEEPPKNPNVVVEGKSVVGSGLPAPRCQCYCAGPVRPIRVRHPVTNELYYENHRVPLFPSNTKGTVGYLYPGADAYTCRSYNNYGCDGYESYAGGRLSGYATGFLYNCGMTRYYTP